MTFVILCYSEDEDEYEAEAEAEDEDEDEDECFPVSSIHEKGCNVSTGCLYSVLG